MEILKITAAEVNELRKKTGAGMMDCKKALTEANGDSEKAIEILRKKGQKVAAKRSDRSATEGFVYGISDTNKQNAILLALNCETDFVAKNQEFTDFAMQIADIAIQQQPESAEELGKLAINNSTIADKIIEMTGKIGEKIEIGYYQKITGGYVYAYNHPGNKVAAIVALNNANIDEAEDTAKNIAMQTAAMAPLAIDEKGISQNVIDKEIEIAKDQLRQEGKPEDKIEMIAKGKLGKFFKENTLLNQVYVKDGKISVQQYLKNIEPTLTVTDFKRFTLN